MNRNIRSILALLLVLVMTLGMAACGSQKAPEPTATPVPVEAKLQRYVAGMTDKEKIGQLVMFGFLLFSGHLIQM